MLQNKLSSHLSLLTKKEPVISRQFIPSECENIVTQSASEDPLNEEMYSPVRGLVHKYENRVLVLLTMNCAAYCRFCDRRRSVSEIKKGIITAKDIDVMCAYVTKHPEIHEVIFSGGDPLTVPEILKQALQKFTSLSQIKIIRIGSRLPVSNPLRITSQVLDALRVVKKQPLYMMLHFEHPAEITPETVKAVKKLQSVSTMSLSQSVFLKGVNDSEDILCELFTRLVEIGVKPYYLFRCEPVRGAEHFIVPFDREVEIATRLHERLSGLSVPSYVIDVPGGVGKVPVALNFWKVNRSSFTDFQGKKVKTA
ncbi:MAG TPA: lysine 2,3-aminomutase [Candidatus Magasanikbacteria bacterium]|nr:MAG: hypothetical protein A2479_00465 [Candidatus Magasanikbacteria bacterium RIFOXYC2_FULL_39_8]HAT03557.1 lysine 2,3-aminomutase [Candidatus Magasanikbacteria bacterium]